MNNITPINGQSNSQQNGQSKQIPVTPDDLTFLECECGCTEFTQGFRVGRLSKVHPKNPTGKSQIVHVPVSICTACNTVLPNEKLAE
jgi:hypothetical protein